MASKNSFLPSWLTDIKEDATNTNEWKELTKNIYDAVDQHLSQSHISYFTELSEHEKNLLLERAARSLTHSDNGKVYENLQSKLSYLLDQTVNNQVSKKLIKEKVFETKTDLVLDTTSEAIIILLKKNPDQKFKLKVFLNQSIPQPIRFLTWQLYFSNKDYRKSFIDKLDTNPKICLSKQDSEIQQKCDRILNSIYSLRELKDSKGFSNSLKGLLSYYHSTIQNIRSLNETEYLFAIPIVSTYYPPFSKHESPTERSMGMLIEIYMQFLQTLPVYIKNEIKNNNENLELNMIFTTILNLLEKFDQPLFNFMKEVTKYNIIKEIEDLKYLNTVKSICLPLIKSLFSGYLNLNSLMFVWDQYAIGVVPFYTIDVSGYHEEFIATICVIILMLTRDQIMSLDNISEFDICLKKQAAFIDPRQIQTLINKYFFKSLQTKLNNSNRFGPIIDPTAGRLQPWEHWHQDLLPRRLYKNDNIDDKLQREINKRILIETSAKEEIQKLRKELDDLRTKSFLPPNNSIKRPQATNFNPLVDILGKIRKTVDTIINSDTENKYILDIQTTQDLKLHKLDLKIAENEVFGHQLTQNEWDKLNKIEKKIKSEQMLGIVKKRLETRFNETGKF